MGVGGQLRTPAALPPEKDPILILQRVGWTGVQERRFLAPTSTRTPSVQLVASRRTHYAKPPSPVQSYVSYISRRR